jgi:hypothetical protein
MGFMLDNLNFRNLAHAQQLETMKRVPAFQPPRPVAPAETAEAPSSRMARLLASV